MIVIYDPAKNLLNIQRRGLSFDLAFKFDFETAVFEIDQRCDYGEQRVRGLGKISGRVYVMVFVRILGGIRVISLRKANARGVRRYEAQTRS